MDEISLDSAVEGKSAGVTIWFTGLSGAGKSTLAEGVAQRFRALHRRVEVLDGDELRQNFSQGLGFTRADRDIHVKRVGYLARLLARNGVIVLVPVIAPYAAARDWVRDEHKREDVDHLQVYVSTGVEECARRDTKGLYAAQAAGHLRHLTGVDDPYEVPARPDLTLDTALHTVEEAVEAVLTTMGERVLTC